eukprot:360095-Chlamydomonas_euryale.AAC.1
MQTFEETGNEGGRRGRAGRQEEGAREQTGGGSTRVSEGGEAGQADRRREHASEGGRRGRAGRQEGARE